MKHLNTVLLILLTLGLAANFYLDFKRNPTVAKVSPATNLAPTANTAEPSPFDHIPVDPLQEVHPPPTGDVTTIAFARTEHDFRTIEEGGVYHTSFKYTNTGKVPLIVSNALGSCGCTVPGWSQQPLKPGETEEITVQFDTKGKSGDQVKTVTVTTNTLPKTHEVFIKAYIVPHK